MRIATGITLRLAAGITLILLGLVFVTPGAYFVYVLARIYTVGYGVVFPIKIAVDALFGCVLVVIGIRTLWRARRARISN